MCIFSTNQTLACTTNHMCIYVCNSVPVYSLEPLCPPTCAYSLSIFRPMRFSSSSMASSSSVKLANILPISLSTLTDTFWPGVWIVVAPAPALPLDASAPSPSAKGAPSPAASALPSAPLGVCKSTVVVIVVDVPLPPLPPPLTAFVTSVGGYCRVGERNSNKLLLPPPPVLAPALPPLVVLPMLSLRISEASCNEADVLSEWKECAILAMVLVDDDEDDDEEECRCGVLPDCSACWGPPMSWRFNRRCLMVPVFSLANGMVSMESMLEFDCGLHRRN